MWDMHEIQAKNESLKANVVARAKEMVLGSLQKLADHRDPDGSS